MKKNEVETITKGELESRVGHARICGILTFGDTETEPDILFSLARD